MRFREEENNTGFELSSRPVPNPLSRIYTFFLSLSGAYAFRRVRRAKDSGSEGEPPCETGGKRRELRRAENGYRFLDECAPPRLFL